jgi:hypothetical protein
VAAGRQDAGVRRADTGLRAFEILQEARAVEQDAGHIDRLVEQHRVRDKLLQPFCSQVSGGFTHIGNGTKRHDSTGCCRWLYLSVRIKRAVRPAWRRR